MALQYRCDICGETKEPGDTYGPGVITEEKAGRPYVWFQEIAGGLRKLGLSVQPFCESTDNQVCGECVGDALKEMVGELWPEEESNILDHAHPGFRSNIEDFEDKLAHTARNPEVVKVVEAGPRPVDTTSCGVQCQPTHCVYTDDGECYHVERVGPSMAAWFAARMDAKCPSCDIARHSSPLSTCQIPEFHQPTPEYKPHANPNGADREDRHLRSVRPVEPVPDPGPAERPLPVPTNCPDCGGTHREPDPDDWCSNAFHSPR